MLSEERAPLKLTEMTFVIRGGILECGFFMTSSFVALNRGRIM